jgi:nucleoside-diphosphate-sugar epimerase
MAANNSKHMTQQVFIVGYGDIGRRVAKLFDSKTTTVSGLARSLASAEQMKLDGVIPVQADLDDLDSLSGQNLDNSLLYYFAPPPATGTNDTRISNFLTSLDDSKLPAKIIYISTSGVYGDQAGHRVTENTPTNPGADRSRRRLDAEQQLTGYVKKRLTDVVILRVSGIYGPGRLPEQRIRDRTPVLHEELAPKTNRIHADDLARLSYLRESRQMDNGKMLSKLRIKLRYPNLSAGLAQMRNPSNLKQKSE